MSLVVFPFKEEDPDVVGANLAVAARHGRVREVWGVAAAEGAPLAAASRVAAEVSAAHGTPVEVFPQERVGVYRPGKGDGMNTALRRAAERDFDRVHFYDADITNFDETWIDGAEDAADRGFEVVRHRFPRASTDAMITWMITRPAFALMFPGTLLPRIDQPLGGELAVSGPIVERLASDGFVGARSDWGIDTVITHALGAMGVPIHEHHVAGGKRHALYGSLDEIRPMVVECLDAARSLRDRGRPADETLLTADPAAPVPADLKEATGYDLERTMGLLGSGWTDEEAVLAQALPGGLAEHVLRNRDHPHFGFMDADRWGDALVWLLEGFRLGDPAWESLAFRLWLMRVLAYTNERVPAGYDAATRYLESTVAAYVVRGLGERV